MAVIFMTGYKKSTKETMIVPVFRLKKDDESDTKYSLYVDLIGRVYQDWTDLMQNNVFLQWWICLPTFGMYTYDGEVQLIFQDQSEWGKVLKNIDKASTISRSVSYHIYILASKIQIRNHQYLYTIYYLSTHGHTKAKSLILYSPNSNTNPK